MAEIEEVRKVDIRIKGRSKLEAPIWSDLNDRQRTQYWKEGIVTFANDPERGNQTWTRDQVLYNSRRNNDNIPDDIANLADNTEARPTLQNSDLAGPTALGVSENAPGHRNAWPWSWNCQIS